MKGLVWGLKAWSDKGGGERGEKGDRHSFSRFGEPGEIAYLKKGSGELGGGQERVSLA